MRNRLRITVRLLDLRAGNQVVWARRFDRQSNDLLSLQDEIAAEVVAQIDPEILLIEAKRSASRPPIDATAYDLVLRAMPLIGRLEREPFMQAGEYLAQRDRAGARLRRRARLVRLLAHLPGRPGLGGRSATRDGAGRATRRARGRARPVRCPRADHRRACARLPAPSAARGDRAA